MVRKGIRLISKKVSTHREERDPRTGSGTDTPMEEKGSIMSSMTFQKSNFFYSSSVVTEYSYTGTINEKYSIVYFVFIHHH